MKPILKWGALLSSILTIVLCFIFLFKNPYSDPVISSTTMWIIFIMAVLPSIITIFSILLNKPRLMVNSFVWLIPSLLYIGVAQIPSVWNLFCFAYSFNF